MASQQRLNLRHSRLKQVTEEARAILETCRKGGASEEEFVGVHIKLKQCTDLLEKEVYHYISLCPDADLEQVTQDQLRAEDALAELDTAKQLNAEPAVKHNTKSKLPELGLPVFNGDKLKFSEFWDRFIANIENRGLAESEKLLYLLSCLSGTALNTISGLTATNANYSVAVETLKQRFGSNDILIDSHYTALTNIEKADGTSNSCRNVLDNIERNLRILEKLGEPINGNHLRALVLSKFPEKVIHEHHLISDGEHNNMVSIRKNLDRIITAMERSVASNTVIEVPGTSTTEALHVRAEARSQGGRKRKMFTGHTNAPPAKRSKRACLFCNMKNHASSECRRYSTLEARKQKLSDRCLQCLRKNHATADCKRKISCFRCKGNHLVMFCPKGSLRGKEELSTNKLLTEFSCAAINKLSFLQMAVATIQNPQTRKTKKARLLLDCGSQRSYMTQELANYLELPVLKEDTLLIYTFGATEPQKTASPSTTVNIQTKRGITRQLNINIVPRITDKVPVLTHEHMEVDIFGDDDTVGDAVHLLIGNDYYSAILRDKKIKIKEDLYLLDTDFGYVLSGLVTPEDETGALSMVTYCQCHTPNCPYFTEPDLPLRNIDVKFLWSLESIGITDSPKATREEEAVRHFNETVKHEEGRYSVKWPWIQYPPDLPCNFGLALGRLKSILKRLDPESLQEYDAILKEQLELGIIEIVNEDSDVDHDHPLHYLPHHMVKQQRKKGRIVYDASAGQKSLNECLYSGPSMLEDLVALLLKFRTKRYGISADVEKAFLQVALQEDDRDVTRFLWIKDIGKEANDNNLMYLRFCRVPFGVISSPFILNATIRHYISQTNAALLKPVADKCYVDNLVTGANTMQEAKEIYEQTRSTFDQLSMRIRDWVSNNQDFMQTIPESERMEKTETVKILGLKWNVSEDNLKLNVTEGHFKVDPPVNTKRKVLRAMARVYDPFGFVCPLILPMKLIFQDICQKGIKWDSDLPADVTKSISKIIRDMRSAADIQIPRYVGSDTLRTDLRYQLHCFTDSSKNAYAAVVYLRIFDQGQCNISFLMAKSRISQTKDKDDLKIPRLELLGFLIGSRLLKYVASNLELEIDKQYLWSDSLVVLSWMRSSKLLPPFVANRVKEIKRNHPNTEMCYINTKENPADVATRPETFKEKRSLWFNGPLFLAKDETDWPQSRLYEAHHNLISCGEDLGDGLGEPRQESALYGGERRVMSLEPTDKPSNSGEQLEPQGLDVPMECTDYPIDEPMELDNRQEVDSQRERSMSESILEIKKLQKQYFSEEINGKRTHLARNLDLFLDVDGILRCRGRMSNTTWSYDMKYPTLLPKNSEFTDDVIKRTHESNYHVGAQHTLNIIRERYWIPQGKSQVLKVLRRCSQCVKHGGGPYRLPATPALPPERVNYDAAFAYTGLDYFGHLFVNTATGREKRWVALFTCLTVRAIHLEIIKDLSAEECLLALRRFAAARNVPKKIVSDNATYFKLVSEVVQQPYCTEHNIQWKFIPQLAPWHGGFYERLVALVKHCLKRSLEKHLLHDNQLLTVMKEVETVLNSRPLTRVGTEVEHVLRPLDFLSLGRCLSIEPSVSEKAVSETATKVSLIESWKRGLGILKEFKKMFIGQYLTSLRERYNHSPKQPRVMSHRTPRVGDLVQIKSDAKNRNQWKVGKIESLIEGRDGECRVARVKVNDTTLTRSVGHLYPLEIDEVSPVAEMPQGEVTAVEDAVEPDVVDPKTAVVEDIARPNVVDPEASDDDVDAQVVTPIEPSAPSQNEVPAPEQQDARETRSRRVAAIRARDKILEWTRHLLALLQ